MQVEFLNRNIEVICFNDNIKDQVCELIEQGKINYPDDLFNHFKTDVYIPDDDMENKPHYYTVAENNGKATVKAFDDDFNELTNNVTVPKLFYTINFQYEDLEGDMAKQTDWKEIKVYEIKGKNMGLITEFETKQIDVEDAIRERLAAEDLHNLKESELQEL